MVQPINYFQGVQDPFAQALAGMQLGETYAANQQAQQQAQQLAIAKQQQLAQQMQQQQQIATARDTFLANPKPTMRDALTFASILPRDQADAIRPYIEGVGKEQQQGVLRFNGQVLSALQTDPPAGIRLLRERALAERTSGDEQEASLYERMADTAEKQGPEVAFKGLTYIIASMPGAKEMFENIDKNLSTARLEELRLSVLAEAVAKAKKAVIEADDTPSRLAAEQDLRVAEAAQKRALTAASVGGEARAAEQAPAALARLAADAVKAESEAKTAQAIAANAQEKSAADLALAKAVANKAIVQAKYAEKVEIAGLDKTNWDINNLRSQIKDRSARLNLDTQKTAADVADKMSSIQTRLTEIPPEARKLINESATLASTSKQAAVQFNDLAKRIESAEGGKGALTSATEWFAKASGRQDEWTQIRNEYTRVRNTVAIKSLPPGVATDKDIELALKGIPPETANSATLGSFLRGMAKLQDIDSSINDAKTDWLSQNNGLLTRAKNTFVAGDYATKPGETFNDFAQRIVGDVSQKYRSPEQMAEQRRQESIGRIPTTSVPAAAPAASSASIEARAEAIIRGSR